MYSNHFERLPQTLQPKVVAHATTTAKKAENICRRNGIAKETAAAIAEDVCDMLAGEFHGMHATYEQMKEVATKTKRSSWARTDINALCMVTEYYARIVENTEQGGTLAHTIIDAPIEHELARHAGEQPTEETEKRCMFVYFTLSVLCVGECCDATEEELRGIGGEDAILYEPQRSHTIATALGMQKQRQALEAKQRERERTPHVARLKQSSGTHDIGDVAGAVAVAEYIQERPKYPVSNPDRATKYYQNVSNLLSEELQLAPFSKEGGAQPLRPLRTAIAERIATAEALKEQAKTDKRITKAMVQRAENLITNADSIYKAIDGIHIAVRELQPTSRTDTATGYTMTAHRFTQLATGQQNPNQQQVINIMRALDFLSMERMEVVEEVVKKYKTKDAGGNVTWNYKKKQFYTRFTPANTTFYGEFGDVVQSAADAFTLRIDVHRMITDGRSVERKEMLLDNGKKENLSVQQPRENYVTIGQVYAFNSEAGNRFRNILLSKVRMTQETLLADVFDYKAKCRAAQDKVREAMVERERVEADTNATDAQKQEAKQNVEDLARAATMKRIASKHKDRDVATLRKMFEDAQACGMIRSYYTRPAAGARQKANGEFSAVVWEWLRPTKDDLKN